MFIFYEKHKKCVIIFLYRRLFYLWAGPRQLALLLGQCRGWCSKPHSHLLSSPSCPLSSCTPGWILIILMYNVQLAMLIVQNTGLLVLSLLSKVLHHQTIHITPADHHKPAISLTLTFLGRGKGNKKETKTFLQTLESLCTVPPLPLGSFRTTPGSPQTAWIRLC